MNHFVYNNLYPGRERDSQTVLGLIQSQYELPSRHYHNTDHIGEMIQLGLTLNMTWEQYLATALHDFVYEPGSKWNELLSAEYFIRYFSHLTKYPDKVATIIVDTTYHFYPSIEESKLVLDLDLERLSRSYSEFQGHSQNIRQEFIHLTDEEYNIGRLTFLSNILNKSIMNTAWGQKHWEPRVRENVIKTIEELK